MSNDLKNEYFRKMALLYRGANKSKKRQLLDEVVKFTCLNRKHVGRVLLRVLLGGKVRKKAGRKPLYTQESKDHIRKLWIQMDQMNSKKMKAALPFWMPYYEGCTVGAKQEMLAMSASTIERYLHGFKAMYRRKRRSGTKPGRLIRTTIPIKPFDYNITKAGFMEADTVAHCGGSLSGEHVWSLTLTDIKSGLTVNRAILGKGAIGVVNAIDSIEKKLPFELLGFNSDNGSEFINYHLIRYFSALSKLKNRELLAFTRSREYRKNDNAHVEQKNYTHVRELFGYDRFTSQEQVNIMNDIYENEWYLLQTFFIPQQKLKTKLRLGSKYKRTYTEAQTPYHRLLTFPEVTQQDKEKLTSVYKQLNPFQLRKYLEQKLEIFFKVSKRTTEEINEIQDEEPSKAS